MAEEAQQLTPALAIGLLDSVVSQISLNRIDHNNLALALNYLTNLTLPIQNQIDAEKENTPSVTDVTEDVVVPD